MMFGIAFVLVALLVGTVPAAAVEYSVWDWWTNNQGAGGMVDLDGNTVTPPWNNSQSTATTADLWNLMTYDQYFTVPSVPAPAANNIRAYLHVEWSAHREYNYFGWYEPVLPGSGDITRHQLFTGAADGSSPDGTVSDTIEVTAGQQIGFYLDYVPVGRSLTPDNPLYDPAASYFTEDDRNGDDATPSLDSENRDGGPANAWGTEGYRHVRVFKDPRASIFDGWSYILAWEDLPMTTKNYDYAGAWADDSALDWARPTEPDYNDFIVRIEFRFEEDLPTDTPELSTWLLLGLSLAAVPVLRRRRRS